MNHPGSFIVVETLRTLRRQWKPFLAGIAVVGYVLFLSQVLYSGGIAQYRASLFGSAAIERQKQTLAELQRKARAGDAMAKERAVLVGRELSKNMANAVKMSLAPTATPQSNVEWAFWFATKVLFVTLTLFSVLYFFVLAYEHADPIAGIKRTLLLLPDMSSLALRFIGVSCLWIPLAFMIIARLFPAFFLDLPLFVAVGGLVVGYLLIIGLLPRFMAAPALLLEESCTPRAALRGSFHLTEGRGWNILMLLVFLGSSLLIIRFATLWALRPVFASLSPVLDILLESILTESFLMLMILSFTSLTRWVLDQTVMQEVPSADLVPVQVKQPLTTVSPALQPA
jgi:hypothetical protein